MDGTPTLPQSHRRRPFSMRRRTAIVSERRNPLSPVRQELSGCSIEKSDRRSGQASEDCSILGRSVQALTDLLRCTLSQIGPLEGLFFSFLNRTQPRRGDSPERRPRWTGSRAREAGERAHLRLPGPSTEGVLCPLTPKGQPRTASPWLQP